MGYILKRSHRKTLSVEITRSCEILVRAPKAMPLREIDRFIADRAAWIDEHLALMRFRMAENPDPSPEEIERLKKEARSFIPERVAHFSRIMGLTPSAVRINAARTRYGSCGARDSLNFSCLLMLRPPEAIDYVVVHELAHIAHKNPGKAFYDLIEAYLPGYRALYGKMRGRRRQPPSP